MNDSRERHHVVISGLDLLGTWKAVLAEEMGEKEVSVNGVGITLRIIRAFLDWRLRDSNRDNGAFRAPWWIELHPEGRRLRHAYWEAVFCGLSKDIEICEFVKVHGPGKIRIGGYSRIASEVILDGRGGLIIGGYALIGFKSILMTSPTSLAAWNRSLVKVWNLHRFQSGLMSGLEHASLCCLV